MPTLRILLVLSLLVLSLLSPSLAGAKDLVVRQRVVPGADAPEDEQTRYVTSHAIVTDAPRFRTTVDWQGKTLTIVDKRRKVYTQTTFDDMERRMKESETPKLRPLPDRMPPQLQKNLEQLQRNREAAAVPVTVTPVPGKEAIAGYDTQQYLLSGYGVDGDVWAADAIALPGQVRELLHARTGNGQLMVRIARAFGRVSGLPLRTTVTVTFGSQKATVSTETIEITEKAPPPELLTPPGDYTKIDFDDFIAKTHG